MLHIASRGLSRLPHSLRTAGIISKRNYLAFQSTLTSISSSNGTAPTLRRALRMDYQKMNIAAEAQGGPTTTKVIRRIAPTPCSDPRKAVDGAASETKPSSQPNETRNAPSSKKSNDAPMKNKSDDASTKTAKKGRKSKYALRKEQEAEARRLRGPDPRVAPSHESGGVPNPTHQYIFQATSSPSSILPQPRRILLVLDLNGTLLHRPSKKRPFHFVQRPHAAAFLRYCLDTYAVAIWSSARPENVRKMVEQLLGGPENASRCLVVWSREHFGLSTADYDNNVQCYKRLTRLWNDPAILAAPPEPVGVGGSLRWDQSNTILVDDSPEKGRSEPFNILAIPEFSGIANEGAEVLPQVHDYLNSLCWQSDISKYTQRHPFKLDPAYKLG